MNQKKKKLNKEIFETIYYGCIRGSVELAKRDGAYSSFKESPFSKGKLQFDLAEEFDGIDLSNYLSGRWDWKTLKEELVKNGARNSMLMALMPTASTAQIMGNSEDVNLLILVFLNVVFFLENMLSLINILLKIYKN